MSSQTRVALLGPLGTFSHQIAIETFDGALVELVPQSSITAVVDGLGSDGIEWGLVPRENSIFGAVTETHDLLLSRSVGERLFIRAEATLRVQQCLLAQRGTDLARVRRVLSHEQALGQCSRYISERFPGAALVKMASTAAAAEAVARGDGTDVAIGCRVCVEMYDGLELVAQGIQQDSENYTRFFLLGTSQTGPLPPMSKAYPSGGTQRALLRIEALRSPIVTVLDVLAVSVEVAQIERRPSPGLSPFSSAYIVEVADADAKTEDAWRAVLDDVTRRVKDAGAEAMVLGAWRRNG